jgi:hypothetical protein
MRWHWPVDWLWNAGDRGRRAGHPAVPAFEAWPAQLWRQKWCWRCTTTPAALQKPTPGSWKCRRTPPDGSWRRSCYRQMPQRCAFMERTCCTRYASDMVLAYTYARSRGCGPVHWRYLTRLRARTLCRSAGWTCPSSAQRRASSCWVRYSELIG